MVKASWPRQGTQLDHTSWPLWQLGVNRWNASSTDELSSQTCPSKRPSVSALPLLSNWQGWSEASISPSPCMAAQTGPCCDQLTHPVSLHKQNPTFWGVCAILCFEIHVFILSATPTPPTTGLKYDGGSGDGDVEKVRLKTR